MGSEKKPSRQTTAGLASFSSESAAAGIGREGSSDVVIENQHYFCVGFSPEVRLGLNGGKDRL
ncbi:hypothetical protein [Propionispora vibrioides]|uniref:Uncharacterized protein n=1 Tax=Propionispora vibrioides TaxID=112903 RepID=A0A1H8Y2Y4_9FIRM|nr:hypothetical protein [Propionispora vibrioides]SEP46660.1 hypothetical protein SAMN04490178_1408 [Propionispora vibrioides]